MAGGGGPLSQCGQHKNVNHPTPLRQTSARAPWQPLTWPAPTERPPPPVPSCPGSRQQHRHTQVGCGECLWCATHMGTPTLHTEPASSRALAAETSNTKRTHRGGGEGGTHCTDMYQSLISTTNMTLLTTARLTDVQNTLRQPPTWQSGRPWVVIRNTNQ